MTQISSLSNQIKQIEKASALAKAGRHTVALDALLDSSVFSEDYPLGDMIELYDIEKEKDL